MQSIVFSEVTGVVAGFCETNYNISNKHRIISSFQRALFECILMYGIYLLELPEVYVWYCFGVAYIADLNSSVGRDLQQSSMDWSTVEGIKRNVLYPYPRAFMVH